MYSISSAPQLDLKQSISSPPFCLPCVRFVSSPLEIISFSDFYHH